MVRCLLMTFLLIAGSDRAFADEQGYPEPQPSYDETPSSMPRTGAGYAGDTGYGEVSITPMVQPPENYSDPRSGDSGQAGEYGQAYPDPNGPALDSQQATGSDWAEGGQTGWESGQNQNPPPPANEEPPRWPASQESSGPSDFYPNP